MDMTINNSINTNDSLVACDSAEWNGNIYNTSGIYIDTLSTIYGCDSITMNLVINYSILGFDTLTGYDSLSWNGNNYDSSGTYVDTLSNTSGCDSIVIYT